MCVDDYAFRHYSAIRDKVCRKFVFVNQQEFAKTYYVNISQFEEFGDVALCKIIIYLSSKGLNIENKKFFLPKFGAIIEPFTFCRILFQALDQKEILLKVYPVEKSSQEIFAQNEDNDMKCQDENNNEENYYCRFEELEQEEVIDILSPPPTSQTEQLRKESSDLHEDFTGEEKMVDQSDERTNSKSQDPQKKAKEAERQLKQVIMAVKLWRELYESKKCNLTNAAKVVGISKKSLDDYFLVLRVGQILGYNYAKNMDQKMGDLRNFIRAQEQKVTGKLGKKVQCFKLVQNMDLDKLMEEYQSSGRQFIS